MPPNRLSLAFALTLTACLLASAASGGDLAPWDGPRVSALAKQLEESTRALYDAIWKQPEPIVSAQRRDYFRLKSEVRHLKNQTRDFAGDLASGGGMEQTLSGFESIMSSARWARQAARSVFTQKDVNDRAAAVRELLNQIAPYYDPDAPVLKPLPGR